MLKRIELENYRCFGRLVFNFKSTSILVGKNNAGKSCLVEALRLISYVTKKCKKSIYKEPPIELNLPLSHKGFKIDTDKLKIDLRTVISFYENKIAKIKAIFDTKACIEVYITKRVAFACIFKNKNEIIVNKNNKNLELIETISILPQISIIRENETLLQQQTVINDEETYLSSKHFRNELYLYKDKYFDYFKSLSESTWRNLKIENIELNDNLTLLIRDNDFTSEIGLMGSGIQMWLQIMWFIAKNRNSNIIILDEPDVYMHPDLQTKLFKIAKKHFNQVIVATHSTEIISSVDPEYIANIDKKTHQISYASDLEGAQEIIDNIGGRINLSLMRLSNYKKCVFLEGDDEEFLQKFFEILYPEELVSFSDLPIIKLGGASQIDQAYNIAKFFKGQTNGNIKCFCIIDSDFMLNTQITELKEKAKENGLYLHIWTKKEIENYLLNPNLIFKAAKLTNDLYDQFIKKYEELIDKEKQELIYKYSDSINKLERGKEPSTIHKEAEAEVNKHWDSLENKLNIVSGKSILSKINKLIQDEFHSHCSKGQILNCMTQDDINPEIAEVLRFIIFDN